MDKVDGVYRNGGGAPSDVEGHAGRTACTERMKRVEVSERELLAAISKVLSGTGSEVVVGVGDDAAVLAPGTGELVITTDVLVEGVHFRRGLTSARDLGFKAIVVNVSDVAAMAASPRAAVCALTLSDEVDAAWTMELFGGMREACDEYALWLVGGNLARGSEVSLAVTVTGEVSPGRALLRSGARPDDVLAVTGSLGAAAAGLRLAQLRKTWDADERAAMAHHFRPVARVGEAQVLASHGATAMIDTSDGLTLDLSRLCEASGTGAALEPSEVPVAPAATLEEALAGGEDYELLVTLPDRDAVAAAAADLRAGFGVSLTVIGRIIEEGLVAVDRDGVQRPLQPEGWDHFA
jgi:thiamine-monophosphate kinase